MGAINLAPHKEGRIGAAEQEFFIKANPREQGARVRWHNDASPRIRRVVIAAKAHNAVHHAAPLRFRLERGHKPLDRAAMDDKRARHWSGLSTGPQ